MKQRLTFPYLGMVGLLWTFAAAATWSPAQDTDPNYLVEPDFLSALEYRLVGPFRGGRVTAVAGVPKEPFLFYMGSTGGGVWKTDDAGQSWVNISDDFIQVGSIGAIAVSDSDPNVIYVGTGSAAPRGNVSIGDGMYRSRDAGKSWQHIGLKQAGLISRVRIHPKNPDLVYVAAVGNPFGPNPERGVYRSSDGGESWEQVLFVNDKVGAIDLALDLNNPRVLFAGMWRVERKPWTLIDGSEEGGLYRSKDGGKVWEKLSEGLPSGILGRIGVTISPKDSERVWVIQETKEGGGVYRSDDGGGSFVRVNRERKLLQRHWYYCRIFADPNDRNTVFVTNVRFFRSVDGGKTFERIQTPHGDNHDLWINPSNSEIMVEGNDGGVNVSLNGGRTWSTQHNQPTAEFYRVTVDNQYPYRLYGAQQDNSTISVPSIIPVDITPRQHWYSVGGGESGHIAVDPRNPNVVYAGNYIGQITRLDRDRDHERDVVAYPEMHDGVAPRDVRFRFQWNAPIRLSPHDPDLLYHASQFVHLSRDHGQSWETISPDLTTNNPVYQELPGGPVQHDHTGVEMYTTIFALEESPQRAGLLWVGSDDGLVHISNDAGGTWTNITPAQMPSEGVVNMIELSRHDPRRAFIAVYRYRRSDFRPYIFRTDNYGESWVLLTDGKNGIPEDHFVRVVREDPNRKGLLFAGTEFGMYISFDDGGHWQPFQNNLPRTPITDLAVFRNDLVVATQGRSFWIMDDLTPLHQISTETAQASVHLFKPRDTYRMSFRRFIDADDVPQNPPSGVLIYYALGETEDEPVELEVLDASGGVVRSFRSDRDAEDEGGESGGELKVEAGLNRFNWDLTYPKPELVEGSIMSLSNTGGALAPPGSYQVRLTWKGGALTQSFELLPDPRLQASVEDLQAQFSLAKEIRDRLNEAHAAIRKIRSIRTQALALVESAERAGQSTGLRALVVSLSEALTEIEEDLIQRKNESRQDPLNYPPKLDNQLAYLYSVVNAQNARPTQGAYQRFEDLQNELREVLERLQGVIENQLESINSRLRRERVPAIMIPSVE